jgi:ABC-2 type transport system permease protein
MYFLSDVYYVCWREMKRFLSQKTRILMTVFQPLVWLVLMGNMMDGLTSNSMAAGMLGIDNYLSFMTPGIMIMTTLFGGVFGGVSIIWDRRTGFLNKMLAAPIARAAIPLGKMIAIAIQSIFQIAVIAVIAALFGVKFVTGMAGILFMLVIIILFSCGMAGISLSLATVIKSHETLMAVVNFLTLPLMFTSATIFPKLAMPSWLKVIATWNPLTYAVEPIRTLTVHGWVWPRILPGLALMLLFAAVMIAVSTRQFSKSIA